MATGNSRECLDRLLSQRILVLDGAMGTMLQASRLTDADVRGRLFADHPRDLTGDHDVLVLTQPSLVERIHREYLEAGSDIIETNTFTSNAIAQADYGLAGLCYDLNVAAARLARSAAQEWSDRTPDRPRDRGPRPFRPHGAARPPTGPSGTAPRG